MKRKAYSEAVTSYTHGISILDKDPAKDGTRVQRGVRVSQDA